MYKANELTGFCMIHFFTERYFQTNYGDVFEKSSDMLQNFSLFHFKSSDLFRSFLNTLVAKIAAIFISKRKIL